MAVDRKRVNGVRKILEIASETDVIILDDAFQHRSITPGFSILLSDFEQAVYERSYAALRESQGRYIKYEKG